MGTPKGRRKKGRNGRNILNSMTENIPKLTKSQTGMFRKSITNTKKSMPMHIIVKVHAIKDREKNFKPEGKFFIYSQSNKNRNYTELLRKPCKEEVSGVKYIVLNFFFFNLKLYQAKLFSKVEEINTSSDKHCGNLSLVDLLSKRCSRLSSERREMK